MSSINSIGGNNPVQRVISKPVFKSTPTEAPQTTNNTDKLELGGMSHLLTQLKTNDIRVDKVQQIKEAIANGTYETDDKIDGAVDKLLDDVI